MNRLFIFALLGAVCGFGGAAAQNTAGKIDDVGRVAITPVILENSNIPKNAANTMTGKMRSAITKTGLGSSAADCRFVMTLNAELLSKEITPTAPPMFAVVASPRFYIGDMRDGTLFASFPLPDVKGVGQNEDKAFIQALRNVNLNTPAFAAFIEEGKQKIIAYYNTNIDFIIREAEAKADREDYDGAIAQLMGVPTVCAEPYAKAMDKVKVIWQRKIDKTSAAELAKAEQAWASSQNADGADAAGAFLANVHPASSSAAAAGVLVKKITARMKEISDREWALEDRAMALAEQKQRDETALEMAAINAAKEVAVAAASQPVYYTSVVYWW